MRALALLLLLASSGVSLVACRGERPPVPGPESVAAAQGLADGGGTRVPLDDEPAAPTDAGVVRAAAVAPEGAIEIPAEKPPANVRISIRSSPRASVVWGRKTLGTTPLSIERPRDSGPMDLTLYARGFLTVHTRAYTFRNDSLAVDMTPVSKAETMLGFKKAPPVAPDGGLPPAP